ncbi:hypothetical protein [Streptomyces dysideae]|uniref:Glycosyltransferase n=1 Tax=Streptomyces dysideae TaxID=909626 RepID=A0A101UYD7_9ACTN|nr:hypothetical protein AQJ91_21550 [Streptomyces dysideae]
MTSSTTLLVIAKEPRPGGVKTRLTPPSTPEATAAPAKAALTDTLDTLARTLTHRRVRSETPAVGKGAHA